MTGTGTGYLIREVKLGDAEQLARAHVAIWKATYPGMVNQTKLDALSPEESLPRWQLIATESDAGARDVQTRCAVHTPSDQIVGFATAGTPRDAPAPASTELWSLNVVPAHHGTGLASELMHEVVGEDAAVYLWVATGNGRAVSFYRKLGFEFDGDTRFDPIWECHESRMTRA